MHIGINAAAILTRRVDDGAYNVDIDIAVAHSAVSSHTEAVRTCRVDAAAFYIDRNVRGVFALMIDIDAEAVRALRGDVGVMHGHLDVAGGSTAAPGIDALASCSWIGLRLRRDGGVPHVNVDSPCASMVFGGDAAGEISCRLNSRIRNNDVDVAGCLRWEIWDGYRAIPVAKIASNAIGQSTLRSDMQVLATDFDVPAAFVTAVNAVSIAAYRVDVVAYQRFFVGLEVDFDVPAAFMMTMNAGGVIVRRVDVDAFQCEVNVVAGSVLLHTCDSLLGFGHFAAHGGLLGFCISGAESEHGG